MTKGGYDVELVNGELENDITCSICLFILKDPMQAIECGHRFCKTCVAGLQKGVNGSYVCPEDRAETAFYPDKGRGREILGFAVRCSNKMLGCPWVKELREVEDHKEQCDFKIVKCVVESCAEEFQRRYEDQHYKKCKYRMVQCPFCNEDYIFAFEEEHIDDCEEFLECCDYCSDIDIPRSKMDIHLSKDCKKIPLCCPYEPLGCKEKMLFSDLEKHEVISTQHHLKLAINKITNQQEQIQLLMDNQNQLLERLSKVEGKSDAILLMKDQHIWRIPRFSDEIRKAKNLGRHHTLSKFIYTSKGYRLECILQPYQRLFQSGTLLSCRTTVGSFDESLTWPMNKFMITSCIIDPQGIARDKTSVTTTNSRAFKKPPHLNPGATSFFIPDENVEKYTFIGILTIKIQIADV
ncbi:TNF receptor-associated factor 6-like [Clytia hemisphaerica]|uniref:Uncharacterized protein n=1 Tax=Clytia hemisphaerica TaxID=252671 RepID=A0A7M5VFX2_9CNID|eukprot:TCONS_00052634-protein